MKIESNFTLKCPFKFWIDQLWAFSTKKHCRHSLNSTPTSISWQNWFTKRNHQNWQEGDQDQIRHFAEELSTKVSVNIKSLIQKALVDNKVFVHSVEVVWTYVDEAKCLTWHILTQSANSQSPQIEWGATGSTQTLQLWSNQGFPRPQHSSSRNFVRLASTKIIFSACVR